MKIKLIKIKFGVISFSRANLVPNQKQCKTLSSKKKLAHELINSKAAFLNRFRPGSPNGKI